MAQTGQLSWMNRNPNPDPRQRSDWPNAYRTEVCINTGHAQHPFLRRAGHSGSQRRHLPAPLPTPTASHYCAPLGDAPSPPLMRGAAPYQALGGDWAAYEEYLASDSAGKLQPSVQEETMKGAHFVCGTHTSTHLEGDCLLRTGHLEMAKRIAEQWQARAPTSQGDCAIGVRVRLVIALTLLSCCDGHTALCCDSPLLVPFLVVQMGWHCS